MFRYASQALDIRSGAEKSAASAAYWRDRLGREWDMRCRRCERTRILMGRDILSAQERERYGFVETEPLCIYCLLAPNDSFTLPSWVTTRIYAKHPPAAVLAATAPKGPKGPKAGSKGSKKVETDSDGDDDGCGNCSSDDDDDVFKLDLDMDGQVFDNDEREVCDEDEERLKEAVADECVLD
jgi:hypothetical protein